MCLFVMAATQISLSLVVSDQWSHHTPNHHGHNHPRHSCDHHDHHSVNNRIPMSLSLSSLAAAHEVLALLGYTLDMWSRHKDSLRVLAYGGDMSEEEVGVVERLGSELRELWEEMMVVEPAEQQQEGASSSEPSPSGDDGEEDDGAAAPLSEVSKVQTVWI